MPHVVLYLHGNIRHVDFSAWHFPFSRETLQSSRWYSWKSILEVHRGQTKILVFWKCALRSAVISTFVMKIEYFIVSYLFTFSKLKRAQTFSDGLRKQQKEKSKIKMANHHLLLLKVFMWKENVSAQKFIKVGSHWWFCCRFCCCPPASTPQVKERDYLNSIQRARYLLMLFR